MTDNDQLVSRAGAPALEFVNTLMVTGDPSLTQPEFDAFVATVDFMSEGCFSASATCDCL